MAWRTDGFAGWLNGLTDRDVDSFADATKTVVGSFLRGVDAAHADRAIDRRDFEVS